MNATADLTDLSLAEAAHLLARREVSAVDLTQAVLSRVERLQEAVNAFIWIDADTALQQANRADRLLKASDSCSPLTGIPMAHKDMFDLGGRQSTCGSQILRSRRPAGQATVMTRLESAGAVTLGGLNMAEFAQGPTGHNSHFGDCANPWNRAFISGGSSSGSGAAIAARMVFASLGSDTGGSIRIPASCCGVTGLKPTYSRVSRRGAMPLSFSMDCIGPLARSAADCALVLAAIAGHDPRDATSARHAVPDYSGALTGNLAGCRIGVPTNWGGSDDPAIARAFDAALAVLVSRGASLHSINLPLLPEITTCSGVVSRVELGAVHASWMRERPQDYAASVSGRMYPAYAIPGVYYVEALRRRGALLAAFAADVFGAVDLIAAPTIPQPIPTRAETDIESGGADALAKFLSPSANTRLFSYLGLPAISLPCGFDPNGLPIGLQLAGRPFAEPRLLRAADAYQRETDWHRQQPLPELAEERS
jgi:aspartyl-tRNA(Asn)/glutamyl-tRNA(Gln) amidotransferase subunit A